MELPTARLNCDNSVDEMQLAAKDLVYPTKSDHILGNTSLQIKFKTLSPSHVQVLYLVVNLNGVTLVVTH